MGVKKHKGEINLGVGIACRNICRELSGVERWFQMVGVKGWHMKKRLNVLVSWFLVPTYRFLGPF